PGACPQGSRNCPQAAVQLGLDLDGLHPAPPNAAEPEGNSGILEGMLRGIEIDAFQRACVLAAAEELQFLRARTKPSRHRFVDDELQLDLAHDRFASVILQFYYNSATRGNGEVALFASGMEVEAAQIWYDLEVERGRRALRRTRAQRIALIMLERSRQLSQPRQSPLPPPTSKP